MSDSRVPMRSPEAVAAAVDGELILLSPQDYAFYGIVGSGERIWELIDGVATVDQIVAQVQDEFSGEPEAIRRGTAEFLEAMVSAGIICWR